MVSFLTSSFLKFKSSREESSEPILPDNGLTDNLRIYWKDRTNFLLFTSNPADFQMTDYMAEDLSDAFRLSGLEIAEMRICDYRSLKDSAPYCEQLKEMLKWADVLYLAGGHAPTQNAFMKECGLKELLREKVFDGIFISISAGTINAASEAYLVPELEGESENPDYVRFTEGLGLTDIKVVPHSQYLDGQMLDGKSLINEIVRNDSLGREIFLVPDGSYFIRKGGITELFGECDIFENGIRRHLLPGIINRDNLSLRLHSETQAARLEAVSYGLMRGNYDCVFEINPEDLSMQYYYISPYFIRRGIIPINNLYYPDFNSIMASTVVVDNEKEAFLDQSRIDIVLDEIENTGSYVRTLHLNTRMGVTAESIRITKLSGNPLRLLGYYSDISFVVDHDWLTDIYSRSGFISRFSALRKRFRLDGKYSVVYTNVKGFKAINDLLGTEGGDLVILRLRDLLNKEFTPLVIARFESDHFMFVTKTELLTEDNLNRICFQTFKEDSKQLPYVIRFGIYTLNDPEASIQGIIDGAELAENLVSEGIGVPFAFYDEKMRRDYLDRRVFISELDEALAAGEFIPYYQPIVDIKSGKIVSAEALVRWKHHLRGMVSPGQFIPAFEQGGHITKIDNYMVKKVIEFNLKRRLEGKRVIPCAVNLSRVDFYDYDFLEGTRETLEEHRLVSELVKLEVTESAYLALEEDALEFMDVMKRLRIQILLDDFGSGMSSMSTLESFDFDVIKLDMGFVAKIGKSRKVEAIIKSIITMAHSLGANIIAEGVETEEQVNFLKEAECDMIQGYYFYKPMPEEEFVKLLEEGK